MVQCTKYLSTAARGVGAFVLWLLLPLAGHAAVISGTWNFTAGAYTGHFSFDALDSSLGYTDSTAVGFGASVDNIGYDATNVFTYNPSSGLLEIGGSDFGAHLIQISPDSTDTGLDWRLNLVLNGSEFVFSQFIADLPGYETSGLVSQIKEGSVAPENSVPEPQTIALMGLGLAGLGLSRRKTKTN